MVELLNLLLSGMVLATSNPVEVLVPHVLQNQVQIIDEDTVFFFGHATRFWDGGRTEKNTQKLLQLATSHGLIKIATVSEAHLNEIYSPLHYFKQEDIDWIVASRAGQHSLRFPRLKRIFVSGGNVGRCLCEGLRDIARGTAKEPQFKDARIYIVRDATYNNYAPYANMQRDVVEDFVQRFFVPSFVCPLQNWFDTPRLVLKDVKLSLHYGDEHLQDYDLEPQDSRPLESLSKTIHVHFVRTEDVPALLKSKAD